MEKEGNKSKYSVPRNALSDLSVVITVKYSKWKV